MARSGQRRSAVDNLTIQAAKAATPGGALIPDSMWDKAIKKTKNRMRWQFLWPLLGILLIVLLVFIIYIANVQAEPPLSLEGYIVRPYSRETSFSVFQAQKIKMEAVETASIETVERWKNTSFDVQGYDSSSRKLSTTRFAESNGYISGFVEINEALLSYASKYGSFKVNDISFDGLAYLAMCNDESGSWLRDGTKTVSSAFPSAIVDINQANYQDAIAGLTIVDVFTNEKAYNFTYGNRFYNTAWLEPSSDQGPSTSAFNAYNHGAVTADMTSEYELISAKRNLIDAISGLGDNIMSKHMLETCTGSKAPYYKSYIADGGDRWNIADSAIVFKYNMETYLPMYIAEYGDVSKYELLCFIQMQHWYGSGYNMFKTIPPNLTSGPAPFTHAGVWPTLIKGICTDECLGIIQQHVKEDLDSCTSGMIDYLDGQRGDVVTDVLSAIDNMKLTYTDENGTERVFNSSTDVSGQGRTEFIFFLYNYLMLEELYSEGGAS